MQIVLSMRSNPLTVNKLLRKHTIGNPLVNIFCMLLFLSSCGPGSGNKKNESNITIEATLTPKFLETTQYLATISPTQTPETTINKGSSKDWMTFPVIPDGISQRTLDIFKSGQRLNNDPKAFSVVGDCDSTSSWFLGDFDKGNEFYKLGNYTEMKIVIDQFKGSFGRNSVAVHKGFNTASVLSPFWADPELCKSGESPLECELRLNRPSIVFVLLGSNDRYNIDKFESNLRTILDTMISKGVIPILATKADNNEGNNEINEIIVKLALEYDVPLWNFWQTVQGLPDKGLQRDGTHLTWDHNNFGDPIAMEKAWPWRNLNALQMLDLVWRAISKQ